MLSRPFLKYLFALVFFILSLSPTVAFCQDSPPLSLEDCKNKITELDLTIARLVDQKQELLLKIKAVEDLSAVDNDQPWTDPILGIEFVWIPEGCFTMGDRRNTGDQDERPAHKVCLNGFYMSKFEMTQAQYIKVMRKNPSSLKSLNGYPVESVSWDNVQVFLSRLNKVSQKKMRLPTEAEWEYAARSGDTRFQYAGSDNSNEVAWSQLNDASIVHKVGLKKPNAFGLYDMSGNVSEWCSDWYNAQSYTAKSFDNPQGPDSGKYKVLRGGNFKSFSTQLRVDDRNQAAPHIKLPFVGFRLAISP